MAVTITRSIWVDDDGTGTTGTVINQALHTASYNEIDAALAKVAQLAGGNTFTGNQTVAGLLNVSGFGTHSFLGGGTGSNALVVCNNITGASNFALVAIGNDTNSQLLGLYSFSTNYGTTLDTIPNGSTIRQGGSGGLTFNCTAAAPMRFMTNFAERMRIAPGGQLIVGATSAVSPDLGQISIHGDLGAVQHLSCVNTGASNTGNFLFFLNNALGSCGAIQQVSATVVQYVTASDQRLKDDGGRATDLSALRAVVVHDFTWKADGIHDRGVFAQEAHDLFPRAVSKGDDELTESGTLARPWMTDYSKFVPDLIVGWQQHDAEIAELRAMVAAVKG